MIVSMAQRSTVYHESGADLESRLGEDAFLAIPEASKVLVLCSGGVDSTVLLFWAKRRQLDVIAIEFLYDGRPGRQADCVAEVVRRAGVPLYQMTYPTARLASP